MSEHNKHAMHQGHNDSIGCTVNECRFHDSNANYCTLEQIQVVKHESVAKTPESTDCGSFIKQ